MQGVCTKLSLDDSFLCLVTRIRLRPRKVASVRILAVTNMYPTSRHPARGTFVEQQILGLKQIGLSVEVLFVDRAYRGMRSYFKMRTELRNRVERFQPDVIHVMYGGVLSERVTHIVKETPIVVSFCGSDLLGECLSGIYRAIVSKCGVIASHISAWRASGVIVKSRNLEVALPRTVSRSKVWIIPNGIDVTRFRPLDQMVCQEKLGWESHKFHVLFPANNGDPVKRPGLAQAAVKVTNQLGLTAEMHQLKGVTHEEVPIWLNASDVVLLTSLQEGSPNVIKEALACDVPIVSVDVGDVRERLHGIDGCYIASPDPQDLAEKLRLVELRRRRIAGRKSIEHLSLEQTSVRLRRVYEEVLASSGR